MYFVRGERILFYADKLKEIDGELVAGEPLTSIWDDLLSNNLHNEGGVNFPKGKKPEMLIKRCLELCTDRGDWVLDSFAGSGTTGATAHKMGRRWLMIELRDHCNTHILPRLQRVIDGTDLSGVSKALNWMGGGGFRYFKLAPSLLDADKWGQNVISKAYNAEMLAAALCKLEGFTYQPVEKGVIDRVSRHGEAYRGEGGFAILRDDEDDLNDQDGSSGRNKHEQGANSARHGLLRGAGADELAHQQR